MKKPKLEGLIGKDLYACAKEVLGNANCAEKWFYTPRSAFGGKTPLELYKENRGQEVYDLLGRIEHGVFN